MANIIFPIFSTGFVTRFIVAFAIIAFLHSRNRNDTAIRKGFIVLISLGAVVMLAGIVLFVMFLLTGGLSAMGNALSHFSYYNYFN